MLDSSPVWPAPCPAFMHAECRSLAQPSAPTPPAPVLPSRNSGIPVEFPKYSYKVCSHPGSYTCLWVQQPCLAWSVQSWPRMCWQELQLRAVQPPPSPHKCQVGSCGELCAPAWLQLSLPPALCISQQALESHRSLQNLPSELALPCPRGCCGLACHGLPLALTLVAGAVA